MKLVVFSQAGNMVYNFPVQTTITKDNTIELARRFFESIDDGLCEKFNNIVNGNNLERLLDDFLLELSNEDMQRYGFERSTIEKDVKTRRITTFLSRFNNAQDLYRRCGDRKKDSRYMLAQIYSAHFNKFDKKVKKNKLISLAKTLFMCMFTREKSFNQIMEKIHKRKKYRKNEHIPKMHVFRDGVETFGSYQKDWENSYKVKRLKENRKAIIEEAEGLFKLQEEKEDIIYVASTDLGMKEETINKIIHGRWDIENEGFNELKNQCQMKHCYMSKARAIDVIIQMMIISYNLWELYIYGHLHDFKKLGMTKIGYIENVVESIEQAKREEIIFSSA